MDNQNIQASILYVITDLFKKTKINKEQKLKLKGTSQIVKKKEWMVDNDQRISKLINQLEEVRENADESYFNSIIETKLLELLDMPPKEDANNENENFVVSKTRDLKFRWEVQLTMNY